MSHTTARTECSMLGRAGTRQIGTRNSQRHEFPRWRNVPISVCTPSDRGTTRYGVTTNCIIIVPSLGCTQGAAVPRHPHLRWHPWQGVGHCATVERRREAGQNTRKGLSFHVANFFVAVSSTTDQNGLKCLRVSSPCIRALVDWLFAIRLPQWRPWKPSHHDVVCGIGSHGNKWHPYAWERVRTAVPRVGLSGLWTKHEKLPTPDSSLHVSYIQSRGLEAFQPARLPGASRAFLSAT